MASRRTKSSKAIPTALESTSTTSSFDPSPLQTPSFTPNAPPSYFPDSKVSLELLETDAKLAEKELDLDLELPISTLLREGTKRAHVQAENSAGAEALVRGELPLEEYIKWLAVLWRVYDALEIALSTHSANPVISTTYDPSLLARGPALTSDITYLLTLLPPTSEEATTFAAPSESTPLPPFPLPAFLSPIFINPEPALSDFLTHIEDLATSTGKAPLLLAHAYVRYLGDLSGGQIIGGRIRRAYKLPSEKGTAFYSFSDKGVNSGFESDKTGEGGRQRLMDIKDWYRRGMDDGVGEDQDLKEQLVAEANLSFALNTRLFALIPPPPESRVKSRIRPAEDDPGMVGALLLVPVIVAGFALIWAFGWYVVPEIQRYLGFRL